MSNPPRFIYSMSFDTLHGTGDCIHFFSVSSSSFFGEKLNGNGGRKRRSRINEWMLYIDIGNVLRGGGKEEEDRDSWNEFKTTVQ